MERILIVDGYNIIGAWPKLQELKQRNMEEARDELLSKLAEYQAFSGMKVIVVFDAYNIPGMGRKIEEYRLEIYYTKEDETADEKIEKLVKKLTNRHRQIFVATSDFTEQHVIFGSGALRLSARELLTDVKNSSKQINNKIKDIKEDRSPNKISLGSEIEEIFEKWRRER